MIERVCEGWQIKWATCDAGWGKVNRKIKSRKWAKNKDDAGSGSGDQGKVADTRPKVSLLPFIPLSLSLSLSIHKS